MTPLQNSFPRSFAEESYLSEAYLSNANHTRDHFHLLLPVCWNMSRLPYLGQVINLDLLLCTGFSSEESELANLFRWIIFTQSPMYDHKIGPSNAVLVFNI